MRSGKQTSIYLSDTMAPLVAKKGSGLASGITATVERYFALLEPLIARMEKEFAAEIPILAATAPLEKWREDGLRGAVEHFIEDACPEELDREGLLGHISELTVLESYALGEAIERAARR